jgi:hypothetical protein
MSINTTALWHHFNHFKDPDSAFAERVLAVLHARRLGLIPTPSTKTGRQPDHNPTTMPAKAATTTVPEEFIRESLLSRLIVVPVLCVSFLISLFFIDRRTSSGIFGQSNNQNAYYHSHQRKLAKQEIDDAFQVRRKVILAMCLLSAMSWVVVAWGIESVWNVWKVRA